MEGCEVQTPQGASGKRKEAEDSVKGYDADAYSWFGASVPQRMVSRCAYCGAEEGHSIPDMVEGGISKECGNCRKKDSVSFYDQMLVSNYFTLKLWEFDLFLDQYSTPMALHTQGGRRRVIAQAGAEMRGLLGLRVKRKAHVEEAVAYLDAITRKAGKTVQLDLRVTESGGDIWLDMCDADWSGIRVSAGGWSREPRPPTLFRRYAHMLPLSVEKGTKADWDAYVGLMNMASEEDKLIYSGYAASLFFPNIDHPILMPLGPQGAAKTSMSVMTRMLVDPSTLEKRGMPADPDALPQVLMHHYAPTFDNCGYVDQATSDILCQACTGGGFSKRKLYTDDEDVIFTFRRAVILNGISAPSMSPDLVDRSIIVELERIPEQMRRERREVERVRDALLPRVRGYLLDVAAGVLRDGPTQSDRLPRLADFARIADACCFQMGRKRGEFLAAYMEAARHTAKEAVRSDPLAGALMEFLEGKDSWKGSTTELWKELEAVAGKDTKSLSWPKDSIRMSEAICGKLKPGLAMMGWSVGRVKSDRKRSLHFVKNGEDDKIGGELGRYVN